jgi:hypothetical protein
VNSSRRRFPRSIATSSASCGKREQPLTRSDHVVKDHDDLDEARRDGDVGDVVGRTWIWPSTTSALACEFRRNPATIPK